MTTKCATSPLTSAPSWEPCRNNQKGGKELPSKWQVLLLSICYELYYLGGDRARKNERRGLRKPLAFCLY